MKSFLFHLTVLLVCIAMAGCGDSSTDYGNDNGNGNGNNQPGANEVWMVGQSFTPGNRQIQVGTTVTWTNQSTVIHTVTSGEGPGDEDGVFDSGNISPGGQFSHEFTEAGTFDYFCIPHFNAGMTGTITVVQ